MNLKRCKIWFFTWLSINLGKHLLENKCALENPTALLRSGIIFRDYFHNTDSSVFVGTRLHICSIFKKEEKQNEFICNQPVIQWILCFEDEKRERKACKFVFLIITVKQNPCDQNIYDRKSYNTRQNLGGVGGPGSAPRPGPRPLRRKTFIVIRLFRPSRTDQRPLVFLIT